MAIQASEFYDVAIELQQVRRNALEEPYTRTAVGRAYYSAYLATRDVVRAAYGDPKFDVGHTDLAAALKRAPDLRVQDIGTRLETLFNFRVRADYHHTKTVSRSDATLMLENSRKVLANLPAIRGLIPNGIPRR